MSLRTLYSLPRLFWLLCIATLVSAPTWGEPGRFELRGIMDLGSGPSFSVLNTETGSSFWIKLGRQIGAIEASAYNQTEGILTLQEGGRVHELRLVDASDKPLLVINDQVIAQTNAAEERRIAAPTRNPRLRSLVVERRRKGIIKPALTAAGTPRNSILLGAESLAISESESDGIAHEASVSLTQSSKPVPDPYPELPEGMRYNGSPKDPNPRILSKNEIPYPSLPR